MEEEETQLPYIIFKTIIREVALLILWAYIADHLRGVEIGELDGII